MNKYFFLVILLVKWMMQGDTKVSSKLIEGAIMLKDNTPADGAMSGASGAKFAFDVATKLAGLYISWEQGKEDAAQMDKLIALNQKEIELLNDIKSFEEWQSTIGLLSQDLLDIQTNYENLTGSYTDVYLNEFKRDQNVSKALADSLTKIRDICVKGFEGSDAKPLHKAFLDYIKSKDIDQSDQFAVSVFKYYIATLYYQGAFLKTLWFKSNGVSQSEIDDWMDVAQGQLQDINDAFDQSIKAASPKYKTLENVKSPFKLYTKEAHIDANPSNDRYYYTLEKQKLALGKALMAGDNDVIIGVKFNKTDVTSQITGFEFETKGNLGLEITTANIADLINIDAKANDKPLTTKTICHKDYVFSDDIDFHLGKSTAGFLNIFNRLPSRHVLVGIQLVQQSDDLFNALALKLYSRKLRLDDGTLEGGAAHENTQTKSIEHITTFESLPDSKADPALADSRMIKPQTVSVITGVCIIKRDHCIQIKLETQDWRSLQ